MGKMSVSLDEQSWSWLEEQAADAEAYVNALVHQDQQRKRELAVLKQSIQDGLDSGVSERTVDEIWAQAKQRYQAKHG